MKIEVNRVDLKFQPRVLTRQGIKPSANACSGKEVGAGAPKMRDACSRRPTVGKLQRSIIPGPTKMANLAANIRGLQVARGRAVHPVPLVAPEPTEAPKPTRSADYVVPFPGSPSAPLRVSKSAPARMSRITQPSPARRIVPAKRFAHTQDGDEPVYPKRRRLFNPYPSLIQATSTPPRGSMSALIIPSPFADSPCSTLVVTSDSVMSLSELTCGRPPKYGRTTTLNSTGPVTGHESSSSGKPGALTRVPSLEPSLITQDTEMAAVDAVGMPEVTMSSVPPTPIWNEGRSSLDDDVEMEERCKDEDVVVWDAYRDGDEVMRDWTDEDVAMSGVT
ncbi:hypothetical protein FRC11_006920 [Ceratobasidium sp. 423]|nr:hypothetical protein FRC11_006920 [Ceratobasidium sp. 423]